MATLNQKKVFKTIQKKMGKGGKISISRAMKESGAYSPSVSKNPKVLTNSKGWKELMGKNLSDDLLLKKHNQLLNSTRVEHMVFPLGPKDEDDPNLSGAKPNQNNEDMEKYKERTTLTDKEIMSLIASVNCQVQRIVHGDHARHVYFWSPDNKALKDALDMAYKLKGSYAPEKTLGVSLNIQAEIEKDRQKYS